MYNYSNAYDNVIRSRRVEIHTLLLQLCLALVVTNWFLLLASLSVRPPCRRTRTYYYRAYIQTHHEPDLDCLYGTKMRQECLRCSQEL